MKTLKPTEKSKQIDEFLTGLTGKDRPASIRARTCTTCDNTSLDFRDYCSIEEYEISGMCQDCQDKTFGI